MFVCCECRVLSSRGLCDELITRPEEPYRLCCVVVCDLETSRMGAPYIYIYIYIYIYDISRLRVNSYLLVAAYRVQHFKETRRHKLLSEILVLKFQNTVHSMGVKPITITDCQG